MFLGTLENFEQKNGKNIGGKPQYGKSFCEGVIVGHIIEFQADWISHSVEGVQVQWKNVYFIPTVQDVFFSVGCCSLVRGYFHARFSGLFLRFDHLYYTAAW